MALRVGGRAVAPSAPRSPPRSRGAAGAARRLPARADGDGVRWRLRRCAGGATARGWRATSAAPPRRRPLQHRPPRLRERPLAGRAARAARRGVARRGRARSRSSATRWAASSRAAPATRRPRRGRPWPGRVRHVVSLGTPHMGAPLAQGVHFAAHAPARAARDAPVRPLPAPPQRGHPRPAPRLARRRRLARPRPRRAARRGLRRGAAARRARPTASSPRRSRATRAIPLGRLLGDWLVLRAERVRPRPRPPDPVPRRGRAHVGGTHHLALLNHPAVYARCAAGSRRRRGRDLGGRGDGGAVAVLAPHDGEERLVELGLARPPVAGVDRVGVRRVQRRRRS